MVKDASDNSGIIGAHVLLYQDEQIIHVALTDIYGSFSIDSIKPGIYDLSIPYAGYQTLTDTIALMENKLYNFEYNLSDIEFPFCGFIIPIYPLQDLLQNKYGNTLVINRYSDLIAANFGDPSRLAYRTSSTSIQNDQSNAIVYRGLSPDLIQWSMYGASIVNPNHLSNAGTFSDQASASSGGVLSIPFETISQFSFHRQPYSNHLQSGISGLFDFQFDSTGDTFFKLGLLGMEVGMAESLSNSDIGIKAHGRYSTVGLLSDLGISFDGESIRFGDLFLHLDIDDHWSITTTYGKSQNKKSPIENGLTEKDFSDISYDAELIMSGLHYKKEHYEHALVFSHRSDYRDSYSPITEMRDSSSYSVSKIGYNGTYRDDRLQLSVNSHLSIDDLDYTVSSFKGNTFIFQPTVSYLFYKYGRSDFTFRPQLSILHDSGSEKSLFVEPGIQAILSKNSNTWIFSTALKSQTISTLIRGTKLDNGEVIENGQNVSRVESFSSSLIWKHRGSIDFSTNIFVQTYFDLPVIGRYNPVMNGYNFIVTGEYEEKLQSTSYGIELAADKSFGNNLYLHGNLSYFQIQSDNSPTRFDFGYVANLVFTKRWNKLSGSITGHYRGGALDIFNDYKELDLAQYGDTVYDLRDYYRIDAQLKYSWKDNNELILDIQNLTNRQNDAYYYYDNYLDEVVLEKQLGMIPILSYKRIIN